MSSSFTLKAQVSGSALITLAQFSLHKSENEPDDPAVAHRQSFHEADIFHFTPLTVALFCHLFILIKISVRLKLSVQYWPWQERTPKCTTSPEALYKPVNTTSRSYVIKDQDDSRRWEMVSSEIPSQMILDLHEWHTTAHFCFSCRAFSALLAHAFSVFSDASCIPIRVLSAVSKHVFLRLSHVKVLRDF